MKPIPTISACALLALVTLSPVARASACSTMADLQTGYGVCAGTSALASAQFRQYGSLAPTFGSSGSYSGSGSVETTISEFPDVFFPSVTVSTFGTERSSASVVGSYVGESESARASADLSTGSLKLFGTTSPKLLSGEYSVLDGWSSTAFLRDQLTVTFGKSLGDAVSVGISMDVTGSLGDNNGSYVQAQLQLLNFSGQEIGYDAGQYFSAGLLADSLSTNLLLHAEQDLGDRWAASIDLKAGLFAAMGPGSFANLGNSAYIRLQLPEGVSYSSNSGVFLTTPVPEPNVWALFMAGLMGISGWVIRARQSM